MANQKYTAEDLKEMQSFSLDRKIQITQTRILEWYTKFEGKVYISFSGGKDSTVLLDLARRMYPDIQGLFIDTGLEYPELRDFVKEIQNGYYYTAKNNETLQSIANDNNIELSELVSHHFNKQYQTKWWNEHQDARPTRVWIHKEKTGNIKCIKPEMNFKQVINIYGYPLISKEVADNVYRARNGSKNAIDRMNGLNPDGTLSSFKKGNIKYKYLLDAPFKISNKCCNVMKKKPAKKYEKETGNKPIIATMACESTFRKTGWLQVGCNAFNKDRPTSQPMSFWTEQDVLQYIKKYNLNYASVYGDIVEDSNGKLYTTKCDRTGCVFCGFGCQCEKENNRFQRLKQTHPKLWEYCMKPVLEGGLGMRTVLDYIGVRCE